MNFLSGNTALKPAEPQSVHTDADLAHPQIPFAVVVNVPLITMTPENGATEFWLGTHTNLECIFRKIDTETKPAGRSRVIFWNLNERNPPLFSQ